jgi:hypothetical protein
MKNKKLILSSLFAVLVILTFMGGKPTEFLVGFVAAGVIPGVDITVGPYMMVALTLAATIALCYKLYSIGVPAEEEEELTIQTKPVRSLKITARTHHRAAKKHQRFTQLELNLDLEDRQ